VPQRGEYTVRYPHAIGDEIHMNWDLKSMANAVKFPVPHRTGNFTQTIYIAILNGAYPAKSNLKTGKI
jgi:hypothetical protein